VDRVLGIPTRVERAKRNGPAAVVALWLAHSLPSQADPLYPWLEVSQSGASLAGRIAFDFTSGHPARWSDWSAGRRPTVSGSQVAWAARSAPDASYRSFRAFLDVVSTYAGSYSLARQIETVADPRHVEPGDVFIQGGFPGHAVLVADVAVDARGERAFLLLRAPRPRARASGRSSISSTSPMGMGSASLRRRLLFRGRSFPISTHTRTASSERV
jgi:hypothetical protein